jgi:hypothetical protein
VSLYDRSVGLQLKLETAQSADTGVELVTRGARLVDSLNQASEYFASTARFRTGAEIVEGPNLDVKAINQALGGFRAGLSRHGIVAFQHQPAATLADVAKAQRDRASRWVTARWRDLFSSYEPMLERVKTGQLIGNARHIVVAQSRAATLEAARSLDPIVDGPQLKSSLGGEDLDTWLKRIKAVASDLSDALQALDAEQTAFTPEVREALRRAGDEGIPLSELSPALLDAIRAAGVASQLVVRRS